jgi:hypothetical protein
MDHVADYEEPIQVVQDWNLSPFHRDSEDEDVDNNIHQPPPLKSANDKTKFL